MAITIGMAYRIVCANATLTQSARLQINEKYMYYCEHRDTLNKEMQKANSIIAKVEKILQMDAGLKVGK
jgi:hypothetical protein